MSSLLVCAHPIGPDLVSKARVLSFHVCGTTDSAASSAVGKATRKRLEALNASVSKRLIRCLWVVRGLRTASLRSVRQSISFLWHPRLQGGCCSVRAPADALWRGHLYASDGNARSIFQLELLGLEEKWGIRISSPSCDFARADLDCMQAPFKARELGVGISDRQLVRARHRSSFPRCRASPPRWHLCESGWMIYDAVTLCE